MHRSVLSDTLPGVVDFMSSESLYSLTDNILFVLLKCTTISIQIYSLDSTKSSGLHPNYSGETNYTSLINANNLP